jgi:hypothetical protein
MVARYGLPMTMPQPGDRYAQAFTVEPGQCSHCPETPSWTGRWFSLRGDQWWRVWACPDHLKALTGLREFGTIRGR